MRSLSGRVVLITGAAGGLGRALIRQFLAAGSRLVLTDLDSVRLEAAAAEVVAGMSDPPAGRVLGCVAADLADPAAPERLHAEALALAPEIDLLVNNAGVGCTGVFTDIPREKWERLMQVNLLAAMRLTWLVLPGMIARRRGHIANVSSVAGLVGTMEMSVYSASKFGLRGFGEALAQDLAPLGIGVTNLYPFFTRTPILLGADRYGLLDATKVPERALYEPDFVIAELLRGIRAGRLHVYPG